MRSPLSIEPGKVATLFVDLQEEHRRDARYLVEGFETILGKVARLQQAARSAGVPVIHSSYLLDFETAVPRPFHPVEADGRSAFSNRDDPLSSICPEVAPAEGESHFVKDDASAFRADGLEPLLRSHGADWLLIAGVWTEACIAATVRDATAKGLRVLLVKDACGSGTRAMHETAVLNLANRLYGGAVADTARACTLLGGGEASVWQVRGAVPLRFRYEDAAKLYAAL